MGNLRGAHLLPSPGCSLQPVTHCVLMSSERAFGSVFLLLRPFEEGLQPLVWDQASVTL